MHSNLVYSFCYIDEKFGRGCGIYILERGINRILFISVMLVELDGFVIKLCVPNNPVKILSRQNYSALLTPLKHSHSSFYTPPPPHTHTHIHKRIFRVGFWTIGLEIGATAWQEIYTAIMMIHVHSVYAVMFWLHKTLCSKAIKWTTALLFYGWHWVLPAQELRSSPLSQT
jgi:hypothetical protein